MLTDTKLQNTKPDPTKSIRLADGQGLYLLIPSTGAKAWRLDYSHNGKRKTISLGVYPLVKLARAREKREAARRLLDQGLDPSLERRRAKILAASDSFAELAEEWLQKHSYGRAKAPRTITKLRSILDNVLLPVLGPLPIAKVEPTDILAAIHPAERRKAFHTALRARHIAGQVLRYAVAKGKAARDVSADIVDALTVPKESHYAALTDPAEIGALLHAIDICNGSPIVRAAMRLAPLVFVRHGELRTAEWNEFDLDGQYQKHPVTGEPQPMWRIPASKMKMKREHLVPLSRQAVTILRELAPRGGRFVFPNLRTTTRPLSEMALTVALRRLGYGPGQMTIHGFRTIASTRLNEIGINPELVELQLAHRDLNTVRDAYNRGFKLQERIALMQTWADHLDELRAHRGEAPARPARGALYAVPHVA